MKRYEAFFYEKRSAEEVAKKFGYKLSYFYNLTRDFRSRLTEIPKPECIFFNHQNLAQKKRIVMVLTNFDQLIEFCML